MRGSRKRGDQGEGTGGGGQEEGARGRWGGVCRGGEEV